MLPGKNPALTHLLEKVEAPRILIVRLSSLGDVVHSLPVLSGLRQLFPKAFLAWIVEEKSCEVVEKHPLLDEVIVFEKARWKKELFKEKSARASWQEIRDFIASLRQKRFHIAIDLQGLIRSGLITFFSGAPLRIGFADAREFSHLFYNIKIPVPKPIHAVDRYFLAIQFLGSTTPSPQFFFPLPAEEKAFAQQFLRQHKALDSSFLVGLFPSSSLPHKCWPEKQFALLADLLIEKFKATILLLSGKGEEEKKKADKVIKFMSHRPIVVEGNLNVRQVAALISYCHLFIGNDTGPLHIAVALGVPVIGLYGPSDAKATGPYGQKSICLQHPFPCVPCIRHPICQNFDCMKSITVDEVLAAVISLRKNHLPLLPVPLS